MNLDINFLNKIKMETKTPAQLTLIAIQLIEDQLKNLTTNDYVDLIKLLTVDYDCSEDGNIKDSQICMLRMAAHQLVEILNVVNVDKQLLKFYVRDRFAVKLGWKNYDDRHVNKNGILEL